MDMAYGRCVLVIACLALAACGAAADQATPTPVTSTAPTTTAPTTAPPEPATTAPPPSTSRPAPEPTTAARGVTIERTGGFVGIDQSIVVEPDGRWTYRRSRIGSGGGTPQTGRLTSAERAELQGLLANPRLAREVGKSSDCADGFEYTLVTGRTKVQWADCGTGSPATAMQIVTLVEQSTPF
ncbi:hypothetical protein [Phytohabitans rumicis]|uniref:Lipoprotein n=1 Tax=Phytohabitans rumicis TaxID=1076125 RepID=A0A6V8L460_9ACTN|nr:hypothetical protein [Phytohabitans rumicis]GFJ90984.1 hypothetical protein Prum_046260 [Phytohabitans rumicis]